MRAAAERSAFVRVRAVRCAWRDNARCDAARRGIFFNALSAAWARVRDVPPALRVARLAVELRRVAEPVRLEALARLLPPRLPLLRDDVRLAALRLPELPREDVRLALVRPPVLRRAEPDRAVEDLLRVREPVDLRALPDDFPDDLRFGFSPISTPARRASESPIAMACFAFFAPCLPLRIWSISRCTNSPACVLADLPARLSARARLMVSLSGMGSLRER